jgi:hypothetical protein
MMEPNSYGETVRFFVERAFRQTFDGIDRLLASPRLLMPTLVLTYSAMDALASLARESKSDYVTGADFKVWARTYLLAAGSPLACSPEDLWGARCGVLHTHGATSKLSDEGHARKILYAYGTGTVAQIEQTIRELGREHEAVGVHIDDLVATLRSAHASCIEDLVATPEITERTASRALQLFSDLDVGVVQQFLAVRSKGRNERTEGPGEAEDDRSR